MTYRTFSVEITASTDAEAVEAYEAIIQAAIATSNSLPTASVVVMAPDEEEAPVAPPTPRKWEVVGQVFYAGGFCLTVEAADRDEAWRVADTLVGKLDATKDPVMEFGISLQEVCINTVVEESAR